MVNNEILGALRSAISRGHAIEAAMQTLINSGYPMHEVQEAMKIMQTPPQVQQPEPKKPFRQRIKQIVKRKPKQEPLSPQTSPPPVQPPQTTLQPSKITQKETLQEKMQKPRKGKLFVIFLILILVLLFGLLITTLIFKEKIAEIIVGLTS